MFIGAKVKASEKNADAFIAKSFSKQATGNGVKVTRVLRGTAAERRSVRASHRVRRRCSLRVGDQRHAGHTWCRPSPGYDSKQLSKIMLDMRPDVEKTS